MESVISTLYSCSILSLSEYIAKRRNRTNRPPLIGDDGFSGTSSSVQTHTPRLQAKHSFDASIGQDLVDREGSLEQQRQQERNRDLLEHSYSSLSDYHSHKQ